ncbi:putative rRNA and tRNA processing protein [Microdochium trichocladiopsis]|uniref:Ribonuclease P protein subunit n=1 Tax=Microdochium trichocladiopsis TaxID=1682393 RepID=A0A9P8YF16_9PEZI|nr:putative rRNA and tRNA processing protein [Microdochium trichocladiopsis]KAH7035802.1 putative rRNA and tRNA processing protein [Microdochium trichocladiopsis]
MAGAAKNDEPRAQSLTHSLLARAHSPDSTQRIYTDKIQHRPLLLRPSSPPPVATSGPGPDARAARRVARRRHLSQKTSKRRAAGLKPEPLSARQRRRMGLYDLPRDKQAYAVFEPLHALWLGYIREILGNELFTGGQTAAAKLASADIHGARVRVSRSSCPSRVGIEGIVVRDSRYAVQIVTRKNTVKLVPKEGTIFRVEVPAPGKPITTTSKQTQPHADSGQDEIFVFEILGDQFQTRSADRANRKFRAHFLDNL